MLTPYDWQEGIGNRAQYIEGKLSQGVPVLALSTADGVLLFTYRRQARKIYEIYDRLAFAAIGQQSDVEAIRIAALDFASQEGFQRSEQDVTIQRVATAMSSPLKRAFGDFSVSPLVARMVFAEVGETPGEDLFYRLDYDGDFAASRGSAIVAGTSDVEEALVKAVAQLATDRPAAEVLPDLEAAWAAVLAENEWEFGDDLTPEAVVVDRTDLRENRFRLLYPETL